MTSAEDRADLVLFIENKTAQEISDFIQAVDADIIAADPADRGAIWLAALQDIRDYATSLGVPQPGNEPAYTCYMWYEFFNDAAQ